MGDCYAFHVRYANPHVEDDPQNNISLGIIEVSAPEVFNDEEQVDVAAWHGFLVTLGTKAGNPCVGFRYALKSGERLMCTTEGDFDACLANIEDELTAESEIRTDALDIDVLPRYEFEIFLSVGEEHLGTIRTDAASASWERMQQDLRSLGGRDGASFLYTRPRRNLSEGADEAPAGSIAASVFGGPDTGSQVGRG